MDLGGSDPMNRDMALRILGEHRAELASEGVESISLFGSVARDEAGPDSDVDLLVSFSRPVDLFDLVELKERLEGWLGRTVDIATPAALKPQLRERILGECVRAA